MGCRCSKESITINNKKYYCLSKIADGGFGTIDLIEEAKGRRQFALKRVNCLSRKELETVSLENKYYKQLNSHLNIIKLIDDDIVEDSKRSGFIVYSIFNYYESGTLQEELEFNLSSSKTIELNRLLNLFSGLCNGVSYIHESNLAHRDLKPLNVLMSNDGQTPVLTDFGSMTEKIIEIKDSRKSLEIEDWAAQNCSMFYRAPELFSPKIGSVIDEKADVWSLGCILYALMFNKGPFDYVYEKGDSIALAVNNAKFILTPAQLSQRPDYLIHLLKRLIVSEANERDHLNKTINELNKKIRESNNHSDIV